MGHKIFAFVEHTFIIPEILVLLLQKGIEKLIREQGN